MDGQANVTLKAFIGRSFADSDKGLWLDIREILESFAPLGFHFEDAEQAEPRGISEKVKAGIDRNEIYLAIVPRRRPICPDLSSLSWGKRLSAALAARAPTQWTTSEWIIEEIGFALGRQRYVLLLIEEGVVLPPTDLDADTEYIEFSRTNLRKVNTKLNQVINRLVADKLPRVVAQPSGPPAEIPASSDPPEPAEPESSRADFRRVFDLAKDGKIVEADALQENLLTQEDEQRRDVLEVVLRRVRAGHGDVSSLEWLRAAVSKPIPMGHTVVQLVRLYSWLGQSDQAIEVAKDAVDRVPDRDRGWVLSALAGEYRKAAKPEQALETVKRKLAIDTSDEERAASYQELSEYGNAVGNKNLAISALEKAVQLAPLDTDLRFRLARLYSDENKHKLAAFHYERVLQQDTEQIGAANNLSVEYSNLGFPDLEVTRLKEVEKRLPLAKANLAAVYVEAGFTEEAIERANEALKSEDQLAVDRARWVLTRAAEKREASKKLEDELDRTTIGERTFRVQHGAHVFLTLERPKTIRCEFKWGALDISTTPSGLEGAVINEAHQITGLFALLQSDNKTTIHQTRRFKAELTGCSGEFTYSTLVHESSKVTEHKGLIYVAPDLSAFSLLEELDEGSPRLAEISTTLVRS